MKDTQFFILLLAILFRSCLGRFTPWASGREYVYHLYGASVNDIPELGPQSAGVKIDAQVVVQSRDYNSVSVKLVDVTASSFHQDLANNWDILASSEGTTPADIQGRMYLERPFVITHRDGLIDSLSVSRDEPLWSVNFKKALASKLQIHASGTRSIGRAGQSFADSVAENPVAVFRVMEDGVTGQCETLYQIAPLSDALIRSDARLNPVPGACTEGSYFQIVKTKDYNKCLVNPIYNVAAPPAKCGPAGSACKTSSMRSSITRYVACGSLDSFTLLKVTHDGRLRINPYGYETQRLQAESILKLVLQTVRPITARQTREADLGRTVDSLVYSFSKSALDAGRRGKMRLPSLKDVDKDSRPFTFENFRSEARRLVSEVVRDIGLPGDVAIKGVIDKIAMVSRQLQYLDYTELKALLSDVALINRTRTDYANIRDPYTNPSYQSMYTDPNYQSMYNNPNYQSMYNNPAYQSMYSNPERTILLQALMATGSNPAVMVIRDAIASRQLTQEESLQAISSIPMFIRTPTPEVFDQLLAMTRSEPVLSDKQLYHTALLSLAQLAHVACINQTEAAVRFPVNLYGSFCTPNDIFIVRGLIPLLANETRGASTTDKLVALTALGELGHEAILPAVLPLIEGQVDPTPLVRTKAVVALHKLAHNSNQAVIDVLSTIFQNPSENSEVRMAAFSLLVLANQPMHQWQKAASSTWFEPSSQVAAFVYTTLRSLASLLQPTANLQDAADKARAVLPLAKPVSIGLQFSHKIVWSHFINALKAGAEFHSEMFLSEDSFIPKNYYSRISWALGALQTDIYEFEAYAENLINAWSYLRSKMFPGVGRPGTVPGAGTLPDSMYGNIHPDWMRVKQQLNIGYPYDASAAAGGPPEGFIHLALMKSIHRIITIDENTFSDMAAGLLRANQAVLTGGAIPFNVQKWLPLLNSEAVMPTTLGFTVTARSHFEIYASVQGNVRGGVNINSEWASAAMRGRPGGAAPAAADRNPALTPEEAYRAAANTSVPGVDIENVGFNSTGDYRDRKVFNVPGPSAYAANVPGYGANVPGPSVYGTNVPGTSIYGTNVPGADPANIGYDTAYRGGAYRYPANYYTSPRTGFQNIFGLGAGTPGNYGFETNIRPTLVIKLVSSLGINAGFTRYFSASGVDTHLALSLPGRLTAGLDLDNLKLLLSWKPHPKEENTLLHYHVRPFTTLQMVDDFTPITASTKTKDVAAADAQLKTNIRPVGQNWLGLHLTWTAKSDLPGLDVASHLNGVSLHSLMAAANFIFLPGTLHRRYYSISHDAGTSDTTEIKAFLSLELADKPLRGGYVYGSPAGQHPEDAAHRMRVLTGDVEPGVAARLSQVLNAVESGSAFHVDGKVVMEGQAPRIYEASVVGGYGAYGSNSSFMVLLQLPPVGDAANPLVFCAEGSGKYPMWPAMDRKSYLDADAQALWTARIAYGNSCNDRVVNITASMRRSDTLNTQVRESPANRACAEEERRGEYGSENCETVRSSAPMLDEYEVDIDYTSGSYAAQNITEAIERFMKAWLYSSLSESTVGVHNPANRVRVIAKVHEDLSTVDLMIYKPTSNVFFNNVPIHPVANILFPLSSDRRVSHRLMDRLMDKNFLPTCRLDRGSITTFDKVQYDAPINDCEYVALSTTAGPENLGILVREEPNRKVVTLYLDKNKVEISPVDNRVRINDVDVRVGPLEPIVIRGNTEHIGHLALVRTTPDGAIEVDAPTYGIKVVTNGRSAVIQASHLLRGKVTGLCGDMNTEISPEFRDARGCVLSSGPLMVASYLVPEAERKCTGIPEEIRSQLRQEQAACIRSQRYPDADVLNIGRRSLATSASAAGSCTNMRTVMVFRGRRKCFSTQAVPECRQGCQPVETEAKNLGFHCLPEGKQADLLEQEAKQRIIQSMAGKPESFRTTVYVPTTCQEF